MAGDFPWGTPGSYTQYLTSTLNSLANDTTDLGSTVIDNETNKHTFMDLELMLASLDLSAQSNPAVTVYIIESIDGGTDYDTATDAVSADASMPPADKVLCSIGVRPGTGAEAKVANRTMILIPPSKFKLLIRNKTGVAFAASGNTLSYRTYKRAYS
jgi:hypothetical protein